MFLFWELGDFHTRHTMRIGCFLKKEAQNSYMNNSTYTFTVSGLGFFFSFHWYQHPGLSSFFSKGLDPQITLTLNYYLF